MKKIAQAISAFLIIAFFVAMILLFAAIGLLPEYGTTKNTMANDVAYIIGITKFQLGVYSAITMVVSVFVAALLSRKSTPPKRRVPSGLGERKY